MGVPCDVTCKNVVTFLTIVHSFFVGCTVSVFTMLSKDQLHVLTTGDVIDLECQFHSNEFNLFHNPILWKKTQFAEESRINILGNINEPFLSTGRFKATFLPNEPTYSLTLSITDLSLVDSGNYTCVVRGTNSTAAAAVTHRIFVRAPVGHVVLTTDNMTKSPPSSNTTPRQLYVTERVPTPLQCVALEGNPPPTISISLGDQADITDRFQFETVTSLQGPEGLRIMHSRVHAWTEAFMFTALDSGARLTCTATVPGLPAHSVSTLLHVQYPPVINCHSSRVHEGDKNVHVACHAHADPPITALFWVIDANGTTVTEGKIVDEYWMILLDRPDGALVARLYKRRVEAETFRAYSLVAQNSIGITRADTEFIREPTVSPKTTGNQPAHAQSGRHNGVHRRTQYIYIRSAGMPTESQTLQYLLILSTIICTLQ